jgi:hypothetical protein
MPDKSINRIRVEGILYFFITIIPFKYLSN